MWLLRERGILRERYIGAEVDGAVREIPGAKQQRCPRIDRRAITLRKEIDD